MGLCLIPGWPAMRSSTVVFRGKETGMGSLIEELRRREAAARDEADRVRSRIEELGGVGQGGRAGLAAGDRP